MQFRIAGFPVRIELFFFLTMGFIAFASERTGVYIVEWIVVAGVGVLIHELGHAVAFRRFGSPAEITLHGFGGVTVGTAQPPRRSIVVSLAGPIFGFAAGAGALIAREAFGPQSDLVDQALDDIVFVTFAWGVLNLLPMLPLDGGGAMASAIRLATGRSDDRAAHFISIVVAGLLAVVGAASGQVFLAIFAALFGYQNWKALADGRDQPDMQRLSQGQGLLLAGNSAEAVATADEVLAGGPSRTVTTEAVELAAWAHLAVGHHQEAVAKLARLGGDGVSASHLVRTMANLSSGRTATDVAKAFGHFSEWAYAPAAVAVLMRVEMLDLVLKEVAALPPDQATNALRLIQFGLQQSRRFPEAARVGMALYERAPEPQTAYLVARSMAAEAGEESAPRGPDHPDPRDEAIAWLMKAAGQGWRDTGTLDVDPNFDALRHTDGFRAVRSWIESGAEGAGPARGSAATGG